MANTTYATERAATSLRMKLRPRAISDLVDMNDVMAAIKKGERYC